MQAMNFTAAIATLSLTLTLSAQTAVDKTALAREAAGGARTTAARVRAVIDWTNRSFQWTETDYRKRTVDEIILRKGGNCNEQALVANALLAELGVRTRRVQELNIQPANPDRLKRAEERVRTAGAAMSVFGLRHNDHVWTEFWDEEAHEWMPADATLNLVGFHEWIRARVGFGERPTHPILPSRDMLVPFALFAVNGRALEPRSERYLITGLDEAYGGALSRLKAWPEWVRAVLAVQASSFGAFRGEVNLHEHAAEIDAVAAAYDRLRAEYGAVK